MIQEIDITKNCPICNNESFLIRKINEFNINKCLKCGLEFTHPMPTEECLSGFYNQYYDIRARDIVSKKNAVRNLNFLKKDFMIDSQSEILDYGCGNNMFIEACREEKISNSFGYDQYIVECDNKQMSWDHAIKKKWDMITLWGVLEHLTSPVDVLLELKAMLLKTGLIALTTIYIDGYIPFQYKPPEHTLYFTKQSIEELAAAAGLSIVSFEHYKMKQSSDVYLSILHRTMPDKYKKLIYHKMPDFVEIPTNEIRLVLGIKN